VREKLCEMGRKRKSQPPPKMTAARISRKTIRRKVPRPKRTSEIVAAEMKKSKKAAKVVRPPRTRIVRQESPTLTRSAAMVRLCSPYIDAIGSSRLRADSGIRSP
jgi:hypothetical protein